MPFPSMNLASPSMTCSPHFSSSTPKVTKRCCAARRNQRSRPDAVFDRGIDGIGEFIGVRTTDGDAVRTSEDKLFDGLGLFLGVLLIGCAPVNFDFDIVFFTQLLRGIHRPVRAPEKPGCLGLGNEADGVGFFGLRVAKDAKAEAKEQRENFFMVWWRLFRVGGYISGGGKTFNSKAQALVLGI